MSRAVGAVNKVSSGTHHGYTIPTGIIVAYAENYSDMRLVLIDKQ